MYRRTHVFLQVSYLLGLLRVAAVLAGAVWPALSSAQFTETAQAAGVDLDYPTRPDGHTLQGLDVYAVGGAAAAADLDGDGWTDLIVARAGAPCLVFMNNRDGTFREDAKARGLDTVADIGGIAVGDLQNRGVPDVFMTPVAGNRFFYFANDGSGRFQEVAVQRGADVAVTEEPHKGQSVSLVDYDRDGYLDIYVSEWSVLAGSENARHSVLLRNRGRAQPGYFDNRTAAAGLVQPLSKNLIANYATAWADFDGDGFPDLFIAGDFGTSQLWWNNGDGTFTDGTTTSGVANPADGMGIAVLDYDGDGRLDLFVSAISLTNPSSTTDKGYISDNKLFRYVGGRRFTEMSLGTPVRESGWGWGVGQLDANNDGWPDLVVTNGYVGVGANFAAGRTDPTNFFLNRGGVFSDESSAYRITDTGLGRSVVILDYNNDGREDIFITQKDSHRLLYRNESPSAGAHWLKLRFVGTSSNRDGYGCEVIVTSGGRDRLALYNPTNAYIGQREPGLHFGLGANTTVERIRVKWPNGTVQEVLNVAADRTITITESAATGTPPVITSGPASTAAVKDSPLVLSVVGQASPAPAYTWFRDGVRLAGQSGPTLRIESAQPVDAGIYTVTLTNPFGTATSAAVNVTITATLSAKSTARWWNEALLDGIRRDVPNPPIHARNLFHVSAALWDAFWAYERDGWAAHHEVFHRERVNLPLDEAGRLAAQRQAMSYAAYTVINRRFARSPGNAATVAGIRWLMQQFGFNPDFSDNTSASPASVGLRIGQQILALNADDGANELNGYADASGYRAVNAPLVVRTPGAGTLVDPSRWQPLDLVNTVTQNGITLGPGPQSFVGSNARNTRTFALARATSGFLQDDPGAPPRFGSAEYVRQAVEVLNYSSQLTAADGALLDISPGRLLNNSLGANDGTGHALNPFTGRPYAANAVARGDYARILAEYWADGPASETPPGHWNVLFNQVSDHPLTKLRFLGSGLEQSRITWDVCGYLALNSALHDAACAAWTLKWQYDSARPITMIRYLAGLGQSSDPNQPRFNANGLPLIPGLIELVTAQSSASGQRHAALAANVGEIAVKSWLGTPADPQQTAGVGWILAANWVPYQRDTFVTPAFPAYVSGHSTFSRAAAEVMTRLTGSEFFPGGLATYDFPAGTALAFEAGPSRALQLQWATYYDAADQAGLSRLYGGIHISADDVTGRKIGSKVGIAAFERFLNFYGSSTAAAIPAAGGVNPVAPSIVSAPSSVATAAGRTAQFSVEVSGAGPMTYQWMRGPAVVGTERVLTLSNVSAADAGEYQLVVRNRAGSTSSAKVRLVVDGSATLANLSLRATAGPGEKSLIAGFVVQGVDAKRVLLRGVGPGLASYGVNDALPAPVLNLADNSNRTLARNERWEAAATPAALFAGLGAFPLTAGSNDAALQVGLSPGSYTAVLTDTANRTGTALIEIYEADLTSNRVVNLSGRAFVGPDATIGIGGFVVRGSKPARYLIRGIGPGLTAFNVSGVLSDPALTLTSNQGTPIAVNDDWGSNQNPTEIRSLSTQVGAFTLQEGSKDAAILVTLEPGIYAVQLRGADRTSGIALLEIYEVP